MATLVRSWCLAPCAKCFLPPPRLFSHRISAQFPSSSARRLVLYSKLGCCLCDSLKEKLEAVFLIGGEESLSDVQLEVRDISTKTEWESAYQYEIPVLARVNDDDSEVVLPRLSPRLSVELIHKKLYAAFK